MKLLVAVAMLAIPALGRAQTSARLCPDSTFFEFQVTRGARWIVDTTLTAHPTAAIRNPANLVQFVVDTTGTPVPGSFRVVKVSDSSLIADVRRSVGEWRYIPSVSDGCKVRQLVQTPVSR